MNDIDRGCSTTLLWETLGMNVDVFSKHDFTPTPTALHGWSFSGSGSPIRSVCGAFWGQVLMLYLFCVNTPSPTITPLLTPVTPVTSQSWTGPPSLSSPLLVLLWGILLSVCQRVFPADSVLFHHTNTLRCRVTDLRPVCATAFLYGVGTWDEDHYHAVE